MYDVCMKLNIVTPAQAYLTDFFIQLIWLYIWVSIFVKEGDKVYCSNSVCLGRGRAYRKWKLNAYVHMYVMHSITNV